MGERYTIENDRVKSDLDGSFTNLTMYSRQNKANVSFARSKGKHFYYPRKYINVFMQIV